MCCVVRWFAAPFACVGAICAADGESTVPAKGLYGSRQGAASASARAVVCGCCWKVGFAVSFQLNVFTFSCLFLLLEKSSKVPPKVAVKEGVVRLLVGCSAQQRCM